MPRWLEWAAKINRPANAQFCVRKIRWNVCRAARAMPRNAGENIVCDRGTETERIAGKKVTSPMRAAGEYDVDHSICNAKMAIDTHCWPIRIFSSVFPIECFVRCGTHLNA